MAGPPPVDLIAAAAQLVPAIRAARNDIEHNGRIPLTLIQAMHDVRLFRMYIPKSLGGLEVDPLTAMRAVELVAAADGAAGWTLMIGSTYGLFAALLPEPAAREVYAAPDAVVAGALRPTGSARVTENGYVVNGRWSFASGIHHSRWWNGGCILHDNDGPLRNAAGSPEYRLAFFPATQGELVENWDVGGLRGTGSHDYVARELLVPESHVISIDAAPFADGPLYRLPRQALLDNTMAVVPLGIARTAINALIELAQDKRSTGFAGRTAERASVQADVGRAEAALCSARAWLYESVAEAWDAIQAGRPISIEQTGRLRLARIHCATAAAQAVDLAYSAGGGNSLYASNLIERCFRDVHAVTQHVSMHPSNYEVCGRVLLGLPPDRDRL